MNIFFASAIFSHSLLQAASESASSVPCTPLANYVDPDYANNLNTFLGGGAIPEDAPVFFDIPRLDISPISPQVKLCIEDLPIPTSIGDSECNGGWNNCWLLIGRHTGTNLNPEDTQNCESSDSYRGTAPCYSCTCSGSDFESGSVAQNRTLINGCGLGAEKEWSRSCHDVNNGRLIWPYDGTHYSNSSSVQINVCSERHDLCDVCRGGYHPQFRVGIKWVNTVDQCSFTSGASTTRRDVTTRMTAASFFAAGYLLFLTSL